MSMTDSTVWLCGCALLFGALTGSAFAQAGIATREAQAEDLAAFRRDFLDVDRLDSREARTAAERRLAALERAPAPLSPAAFILELCRIAAMADNGHSQCLATASPRVPLEFMPIDGGSIWLARARGCPSARLTARIHRRPISGPPHHRRADASGWTQDLSRRSGCRLDAQTR